MSGHVTVPQDNRESKRNMKHYYWVKPEYNKSETVEIYAPYDGYVSVLRNGPGLNLAVEIETRILAIIKTKDHILLTR